MYWRITLGIVALWVLLLLSRQNMLAQGPSPASDSLIHLKRATFDPLVGGLPTSRQQTYPSDMYLVQFNGPVQAAWKASAEQVGAKLYGYIPDHTFIARIKPDALAQMQALPFIRWIGPYEPMYRLDAALVDSSAAGAANVLVETLPDTDLRLLNRQIALLSGTVVSQSTNLLAGYGHVTLPATRLPDLARLDGVVWVEPEQPVQLLNDIAGGQIMHANQVRQALGLFGAGQIVAVADTGLDLGNPSTIHPDFSGRIIKGYCLGRPSPCDWSDLEGHGTHVAGSVLGSGKASGSNPATRQYGNSFAGVAPEARLVMQSIMGAFGSLDGIPADEGDLMRQAYRDGARIHSNSWGGPTGGTSQFPQFGGYVLTSQQVDQAAWEHKDMLILFAAGNSGTDEDSNGVVDPDTIGQPGTAKNIITVGASENLRPGPNDGCSTWSECFFFNFSVEPIANDLISNNANGMAAFSSRGPTDDGRIKPDLVAPGTNIISARSRHPSAGVGWGEYDANYIYESGTSMATPLTAGAAAVTREWLIRGRGIGNPSAALIKGVLIIGAADMSPGQYGVGAAREIPGQRFNNVTGWGRVDLGESLNPGGPRTVWLADNQAGLTTGATKTYDLQVAPPQLPAGPSQLRLTLIWTDYPGEPAAAKALVNDLDLELIGPDGTHYTGNQGVYTSGQCLRAGKWDACNNSEGISIPQALPGIYKIVVHGTQVPQGGAQPFALVASGAFVWNIYLPLVIR